MPPLWSSPCSPLGSGRGSGRILVTGDLETRLLAVSLHSFFILNNAELPHKGELHKRGISPYTFTDILQAYTKTANVENSFTGC
jgi:hypothetical protein